MPKSKSIQLYLHPAVPEEEAILGIWDNMTPSRRQEVMRKAMFMGLLDLIASGQAPEEVKRLASEFPLLNRNNPYDGYPRRPERTERREAPPAPAQPRKQPERETRREAARTEPARRQEPEREQETIPDTPSVPVAAFQPVPEPERERDPPRGDVLSFPERTQPERTQTAPSSAPLPDHGGEPSGTPPVKRKLGRIM